MAGRVGFFLGLFFLAMGNSVLHCQDAELGKDLAEEGVFSAARVELIKALHDPSKKSSHPLAQYYLGYMDFRDKNYEHALKHWRELLTSYPNSPFSQKAKDQTQEAYRALARQQEVVGQDLEVNALFDNADFLIEKPLKVSVDTSYLPSGDLAIECLEQIVSGFPNSPEAARALLQEALVYYGWGERGIGEDGTPTGYGFTFHEYYVKDRVQAHLYIGKMLGLLARLQANYPESRYAIVGAYLIGQAYWADAGGKVDEDARGYWSKVLELSKDDKTNVYRQVVEWRLKAR